MNTNFQNNKITKVGSQFICVSVVLFNSAFRPSKTYYPQVFLEEFKFVVKEKKIPDYIAGNIEILVMILIEKILMKKTLMQKK